MWGRLVAVRFRQVRKDWNMLGRLKLVAAGWVSFGLSFVSICSWRMPFCQYIADIALVLYGIDVVDISFHPNIGLDVGTDLYFL
jgi:hypothetical protein